MRTGETQIVTLRLLKGFALLVDDDRVALSSSAQRLLAFLALQDRPRTRTYVARTRGPVPPTPRATATLPWSLWGAPGAGRRVSSARVQEKARGDNTSFHTHGAVASEPRLLDR